MGDTPIKVSPLQVHTTDRQVFRSCRLKWHFSSNLRMNLRPPQTPEALLFGSAMHAGLAQYYIDNKSYLSGVDGLLNYLTLWFADETDQGPEAEDQFDTFKELGLGMLDHYHQTYKNDGIKVEQVEQKYEIRLGDCPYCIKGQAIYFGVIGPCHKCSGTGDLIYSFQIDALMSVFGKYWILEHKTASRIEDDTEYLQLDDQCGSYLWGVQKVLDIKVEGVVYNSLLKTVPKPLNINKNGLPSMDKRQNSSYQIAYKQLTGMFGSIFDVPSDYLEFLDYIERQTPTLENPLMYDSKYLRRVPVRRSAAEIEAEGNTIKMEVADMLDPELKIYRNPNRFNCGGCSFVGPCIAYYSGADLNTILTGNYVDRH